MKSDHENIRNEGTQLSTPVAIVLFNRADTLARVFEKVREQRPKTLLLIADGPRATRPGEGEKCARARAVVESIDWPCRVLRNYSDVNFGCKKRLATGMNWLFEQVEEAIIVEDDCLPDSTFFQFCEENLERYRNDPRVFQIAGTNHLIPPCDEKTSYGFSKYASIWGWASWRRAWKNYDPELLLWRNADTNRKKSILKEMKLAWMEQVYWARKFDKILAGHDTWDYQWVFACLKNQGLSIVPRINLISNIGFGPEATHTTTVGTQSEYPIGPTKFPMVHPSSVSASASYDRAYLRRSIVERVMIPLKKFKILERR